MPRPHGALQCDRSRFWPETVRATILFVSQAPLETLRVFKRWMGWSFPWVSSAGNAPWRRVMTNSAPDAGLRCITDYVTPQWDYARQPSRRGSQIDQLCMPDTAGRTGCYARHMEPRHRPLRPPPPGPLHRLRRRPPGSGLQARSTRKRGTRHPPRRNLTRRQPHRTVRLNPRDAVRCTGSLSPTVSPGGPPRRPPSGRPPTPYARPATR